MVPIHFNRCVANVNCYLRRCVHYRGRNVKSCLVCFLRLPCKYRIYDINLYVCIDFRVRRKSFSDYYSRLTNCWFRRNISLRFITKFFPMISPFLPFTYAVGLMREAVGGIVWSNALFDILMLLIFLTIALLIGTFLKEPINRRTQKLMDKSKELSIFQ